MAKQKNGMKRTKGGSPIIDVPIVANVAGGEEPIYRQRPRAQVQAKSGITYMVPIDPKTGRVPEDALYEHFRAFTHWSGTAGKNRSPSVDARTPAKTIHAPKDEKGFTPEEIVQTGWWAAVNQSDIMGVDDSTSSVLRDWDNVKSAAKPHLGKIAIIAPEESQEKIIATLQNNFTASELKRMTDKTGLIIIEGNPGYGADGCYYRRQEGVETPNIFVRASSGEDTITHEVVHHARSTDQKRKGIAKTPYPQDENDKLIPFPTSMAGSISNLEEACTVAETTARTRGPTDNLGYYTYLNGNPQELYDQDRATLITGKPLRGKRAVDRINDRFEDTNISELQFKKNGKKAKTSIEQGRAEGKYPPRKTSTKTATAASSKRKLTAKPKTSASPKRSAPKNVSKPQGSKKPASKAKPKATTKKSTPKKSASKGGRR